MLVTIFPARTKSSGDILIRILTLILVCIHLEHTHVRLLLCLIKFELVVVSDGSRQ